MRDQLPGLYKLYGWKYYNKLANRVGLPPDVRRDINRLILQFS